MKHFFKVLSIFVLMIILGIIGVVMVSHYENSEEGTGVNAQTPVAK